MKWIALIPMSVLLTACGFTNSERVEYRQVSVTPVVTKVVAPVVTKRCCPGVLATTATCCPTARPYVVTSGRCCGTAINTPVVYRTSYSYPEPVDVSTSTVEYY